MKPPTLESVACPFTGRHDGVPSDTVSFRGVDLPFLLCPTTGLQYMSPRPTAQWYRHHYAEEFWTEHTTGTGFSHKGRPTLDADEGTAQRLAKQLWRAQRIARLLQPHVPLEKDDVVVDIGGAWGVTSALLRQAAGIQPYLVEPSDLATDFAMDRLGVSRLAKFAEELLEPTPLDGRLRLVILSHALENLLDPLALLKALRRKLRPGGHIYIDTPNFFYVRAANPYHPFVFNLDSLTRLLAMAGFRVVFAHHAPHPTKDLGDDQAIDHTDAPYLSIVATPDEVTIAEQTFDPEDMMRAQSAGIELIRQAKKRRKKQSQATKVMPSPEEVDAFLDSAAMVAQRLQTPANSRLTSCEQKRD